MESIFALGFLNNGLYGSGIYANRKARSLIFRTNYPCTSERWRGHVRFLYEQLKLSEQMSAGEFLDSHHPLLLFKPFLSAERYELAQTKFLDTKAGGMWLYLGISNMPFFKSPYHYCWECMKQELRNVGYAFPHRTHQLLGVNLCPIHDTALGILDEEAKGFDSIDGLVLLAAETIPSASPLKVSINTQDVEASRRYGAWVHFILGNKLPSYPVERRLAVVEAKLQSLKKQPGVPNSMPARLESVLRRTFGTGFLNDLGWKLDAGPTALWPAMLLHGRTFYDQPIANILVLASLFEHPQEFIEMVSVTGAVTPGSEIAMRVKRPCFRVAMSRRLLKDFLSMPSLEQIARKHDMCLETVRAQLHAVPGLAGRRQAALARRLRRRHRRVAEKMMQDNPKAFRKILDASHKGTCEWLRKNDSAWFDRVVPRMPGCRGPTPAVVCDYSQEDIDLAKQLGEFIEKTIKDLSAVKITKRLLFAQLSMKDQSLFRKGLLPQTKALIREKQESIRQYDTRVMDRIRRLIDQGDLISGQTLATHFLSRNKSRVDLRKKVTALVSVVGTSPFPHNLEP